MSVRRRDRCNSLTAQKDAVRRATALTASDESHEHKLAPSRASSCYSSNVQQRLHAPACGGCP